MRQIRARRRAELMHDLPAVPRGGPALDDGDDLLPEAGGELVAAGAHGALAVDDVEDPGDGLAAAGAGVEGLGDLERVAAAREALERAHAHDGRHRIDRERQVQQRVQRQLLRRRGARE